MSKFTQLEQVILDRSMDLSSTRRRIYLSIIIPIALICIAIPYLGSDSDSKFLVGFFVLYVLFGIFEKVSYGFTVLTYKTVIQKLITEDNSN